MGWSVLVTAEFEGWLRGLDARSQAAVVAGVRKVEIFGPTLPRPHADTLRGSRHANMKELRIKHAGSQYRVLYAFDPGRNAVMLVAGDKAGDRRFYERLIPIADGLLDAHLRSLKKR